MARMMIDFRNDNLNHIEPCTVYRSGGIQKAVHGCLDENGNPLFDLKDVDEWEKRIDSGQVIIEELPDA